MPTDLEKKIKENFKLCNIKLEQSLKIGAAVSGGADSVSLLISLCNILSPLSIPLNVITVNHNIREENETKQDADFVKNLCSELSKKGFLVECEVFTFERNQVFSYAEENGGGIENAARILRYEAFEKFIQKNSLDFLCLAHNKNDQCETVLMRFLQGGNLESLCGIRMMRNKYLRPLLTVSRDEIENYLKEKNQTWRTDSSNESQDYLRNKIRLSLIPFLNENFPFWEQGILTGQKKYSEDLQVILSLVEKSAAESRTEKSDFAASEFPAVQKRLVLKKMNACGISQRIPNEFLNEVFSALNESKNDLNFVFKKKFSDYDIIVKNGELSIKKSVKKHTDSVFFDIIEKDGSYNFPFGTLNVLGGKLYLNERFSDVDVKFPFCIRNVTFGDFIKMSDGKEKKIRDILSDWHVPLSVREKIPIIVNVFTGETECILSDFLGYKDWVVKK